MRNFRPVLEILEDRCVPADFTVVCGNGAQLDLAKASTYLPYNATTDTVTGTVNTQLPGQSDRVWINYRSTANLYLAPNTHWFVGQLVIDASYPDACDVTIGGRIVLCMQGGMSKFADTITLREFGTIDVWKGEVDFKSPIYNNQVLDTASGLVVIDSGATARIYSTFDSNRFEVNFNVLDGGKLDAILDGPRIKIADKGSITINHGGGMSVFTDGTLRAIEGNVGTERITNYGVFYVQPNSNEVNVLMPMDNFGSIFRVGRNSSVRLAMAADNASNELVMFGGSLEFDDNSRLILDSGYGTASLNATEVKTIDPSSLGEISARIHGGMYLNSCEVRLMHFGMLAASSWVFQDCTITTIASGSNQFWRGHIYASGTIECYNTTLRVIFSSPITIDVAGGWYFFYAAAISTPQNYYVSDVPPDDKIWEWINEGDALKLRLSDVPPPNNPNGFEIRIP